LIKANPYNIEAPMKPNWDEIEASKFEGELGQLIYAARLLGQDESFGIYGGRASHPDFGGGNASVKITVKNLLGDEEQILYVDHGQQPPGAIEAGGFSPLRCEPLAGLARLEGLTTSQLENELACCRTLAAAPAPPVDTLLHAALPYKFILFTQPDELLAMACTPSGAEHLRDLYGDTLWVLPYAPSGLALAKACTEALQASANPNLTPQIGVRSAIGIFIQHQGLLTFGDTARLAYERLVDLVDRAGQYLKHHGAWHLDIPPANAADRPVRQELAALRQAVSAVAGFPLILAVNPHPAMTSLSRREDIAALAQQGPVVARDASLIKHLPLIGRDVEAYRTACEQAFSEYSAGEPLRTLDCAPRIILDPDLGLCSLGRTAVEAVQAGQRYLHTIDIILHATTLEGYQPLPQRETIAAEAAAVTKTVNAGGDHSALFTGEVALVTGGASGIGKACVESLLERGAAVVSMDINPKVKTLYDRPDYLGLECDLTDETAILKAFEALGKTYGGLDMLVLNAGIFPGGVRIEALNLAEWQRVMRINLDSNVVVLREAYPLLKHSPRGGRVLVNASKNVLAPGAGAAAYSSSKAAVTQLARIAALEWGKDHIRVNLIHPDAIFDTGIWTEDVLKARAAHYGLTVQQYKTRNVLGVELNSRYVGELVAEMLGPRFEKITGAQIPVDGGSDRVI
jgi:rhamnose utilization protein RhaD (predicted bifunctional aldolase and dehydrogenase)/NAD(P)-dependent dehydrogenase (short-subunit alcohol dehydrogenase family)